MIVLPIYCGS